MLKPNVSMKLPVILTCCLGVCLSSAPVASLRAQAPAAETAAAPKYSDADLDQLLGPIALYPDPMIALILPAATTPSDVVLAARYTAAKGDPEKVSDKQWDDSVKALVHYPDVIQYMDQNLDWTTDLGEAFVAQPADVMNSIQQLRAQAQAAGNLKDTPQQTVVVKEEKIIIMPAEPKVIYVPQYDPAVVYVASPTPPVVPLISFGLGLAVGSWLNHDCDWYHHGIYVGPWNSGYGWGNRPVYNNNYNNSTNVNINNNNNWNHNGNNNIGNGNGNNGGMWKPNPSRPGANRPGGNGNGFRPGDNSGIGNRPGGQPNRPGTKPGERPNLPGNGGNNGNRPNLPGNGGNNGNKPSLPNKPDAGANRPTTLPAKVPPTNRPDVSQRPGAGSANRPTTRPAQTPQRPGNDAFSGYDRGASTRVDSQRGQASRQQAAPQARSGGGGARQSGGGGGGNRSGGGGGGGGKRGGR